MKPVVLVAHIYYPDVVGDVVFAASRLKGKAHFLVSLVEGRSALLADSIKEALPESTIRIVENRGRDIAPFLYWLNSGHLDGYELVCKIHGKKSVHLPFGEKWREHCFDCLLSESSMDDIQSMFASDAQIGMVAPGGFVLGDEAWGKNRAIAETVAARRGMTIPDVALQFPAGSMFWARREALDWISRLRIGEDDFEQEAGHLDGTLAHAVERLLGMSCLAGAMRIAQSGAMPSEEVRRIMKGPSRIRKWLKRLGG